MNAPTTWRWLARTAAALLLTGGMTGHQAFAANFVICVQSDANLAQALNEARFVPVTVKIVQHALTAQNQPYDLHNTVWDLGLGTVSAGSEILGGYTAGCGSRDIAAGNTRLVNSSNAQATVYPRGSLTVEGLTFSIVGGLGVGMGSPGYNTVNAGANIVFRRDAFTNANFNSLVMLWVQVADSQDIAIRVVDSLFANNNTSDCALALQSNTGFPEFDVVNNTVIDNNAPNVAGACFYGFGNETFKLYNNIFYGTTGVSSFDFLTNTDRVVQHNNIWGTRSGPAAIQSQNNQSGTDPKLDVTYRPIEVPQSPAINAGTSAGVPGGLPGSDLDGGPRVVGQIVDIGAYESSIDPHPVQTVTKVVDDGTAGTLRAAITSVNSNGGGTITFDIGTGCGPHVITVSKALGELPGLIQNTTINGFTQTGASANGLDVGDDATICVILEAEVVAGTPGRGLVVSAAAADGKSVTIKGLGFSNFATTAIDLQGGSGHTISGNHFGGSIGGHAMLANGFDVRLGPTTHDNVVGGNDNADRNIVGDATGSGVVVANGSTANQILGNYIGIGWGATFTNRGNGARGVYVAGDHTTIDGNLIGDNAQSGIVLDSGGAHDNTISNNFIGVTANGTNLGNASSGIRLLGTSGDAPETNVIRFNTIGDNGAQGILVDFGQGNRIRRNSIHDNALLGIDLGTVGVAFPQSDDGGLHVTDEANRSQNFPTLTSASGDYAGGVVSGTLTTTPGDKTVDIYANGGGCDASGYGEGKTWIGSGTVTVPTPGIGFQGTKTFSIFVTASLPVGAFFDGLSITATATDANDNTSEFSACTTFTDDGIFLDGFEPPAV